MNAALLALNVFTGGNIKKQAVIVFATMTIMVTLPFAAVFSMGSNVLDFLSGVPSLEAAETLECVLVALRHREPGLRGDDDDCDQQNDR